jgi:hypothetical protein
MLVLLVTSCARFSNDYDDDEFVAKEEQVPLLTEEELIKKLEGVTPTIQSVSPGKPYPVKSVQVIPSNMQRSCCTDVCRGKPKHVAREPHTKYVRCTCQDGRMFRVTRLKGKG